MLNEKALLLEDSITLSLTAIAQKMKREGKDVISFTAGEPDFDTPKHIKAAGIAAIEAGKNKYTAVSGIIELRTAISEKLKKDNHLTYSAEEIVVSCGAKHSLFNAFGVIINPNDEVIIPAPYWVSYPPQVSFFGGKPVYLETKEANGLKITAQDLKAIITPKTKVLILNSPSNPTGMIYSQKELESIADIALTHNLFVISDEIYEKLNYSDKPHFSIAEVSNELKKRTILINGLSKSYSMTGWRIGYSACDLNIAKAMASLQSHSTSNPTTAAQWASLAALTGPETEIETMRQEFNRRRIYMVETLNKIKGISCLMPEGAFYAFPNIKECFNKKTKTGRLITNSFDFCDALLKEIFVSTVPGSGFGSEGFMRLSYATSFAQIKEGLARIDAWVTELS
ncbi:MAG: pyridoxal phosphate-dependent aminotransferase [Candidatus Margulisiibacteriota bacterium]|jgi:aspartate aminotransferase